MIIRLRENGASWRDISEHEWMGSDGQRRKYDTRNIRKIVKRLNGSDAKQSRVHRVERERKCEPLTVHNPPNETWNKWTLRYMGFAR
jgi:hypothetical protein